MHFDHYQYAAQRRADELAAAHLHRHHRRPLHDPHAIPAYQKILAHLGLRLVRMGSHLQTRYDTALATAQTTAVTITSPDVDTAPSR